MTFDTYQKTHSNKETVAFKLGQDYGFTQFAFLLFLQNNDTSGIQICQQFSPSLETINMVLDDIVPARFGKEETNLKQAKAIFKFLMLENQ